MPSIQASLLKDVAQSGSQLKSKGSLILTGDGNERPLPLSLLMVLDVSGSMRGSGITVVTESVVHILNNLLGPEDKIAVITFNGSANVHTPWIDVSGNVPPFSAGGGTNFGAAVNSILDFLGAHDAGGDRAGMVLFLSDGHAGKPKDDHVASIPEFGFTMHTIGVTAGADPTQLEHMAELARGHYFHAPNFSDVETAFSSIFNLGKTVVYAAPELVVEVSPGSKLSNLVQSPQGIELASELGPGRHTVSMGHLSAENRLEMAFDAEIDMVQNGPSNTLATFSFRNATATLSVRGATEITDVYNAPINQQVTLISQTARAATATKRGDMATATRAITKLEDLSKTIPAASSRATTLTSATEATDIGTRLQQLGKIQATESGETKLRED